MARPGRPPPRASRGQARQGRALLRYQGRALLRYHPMRGIAKGTVRRTARKKSPDSAVNRLEASFVKVESVKKGQEIFVKMCMTWGLRLVRWVSSSLEDTQLLNLSRETPETCLQSLLTTTFCCLVRRPKHACNHCLLLIFVVS